MLCPAFSPRFFYAWRGCLNGATGLGRALGHLFPDIFNPQGYHPNAQDDVQGLPANRFFEGVRIRYDLLDNARWNFRDLEIF